MNTFVFEPDHKGNVGLPRLLELLPPEVNLPAGCKIEVLRCFKALMNNEVGLTLILETEAAVRSCAPLFL
jgi:hypothetical protein